MRRLTLEQTYDRLWELGTTPGAEETVPECRYYRGGEPCCVVGKVLDHYVEAEERDLLQMHNASGLFYGPFKGFGWEPGVRDFLADVQEVNDNLVHTRDISVWTEVTVGMVLTWFVARWFLPGVVRP